MFFNMKIEVNEDQPLDDVVSELERLGYKKHIWENYINMIYVVSFVSGVYTNADFNPENELYKLTTLPELKEM